MQSAKNIWTGAATAGLNLTDLFCEIIQIVIKKDYCLSFRFLAH